MPRKPRTDVEPRLRNIPGRRKLYIEWTPVGGRSSQRRSTGVEGDARNPPTEAVEALEAFKAALDAPATETVQDIMDARLKDAEGRVSPVSLRNMRQQHKNLCARLGHLAPTDLTRARIKRYIERERAGTPTAAARELEELRSAFRLVGLDVPRDWPDPPKRPPRDRYLTPYEAKALIDACQVRAIHLHLFVLIALSTGARKSAILGLTWDRVDEDRGVLDFNEPDRPMTKKRRPIARVDRRLSAALREARKVARSEHVIEWNEKPIADIKKGLAEAAVAAGLYRQTTDKDGKPVRRATISAHTLKHTAISWLAEAGYTVDQISDLTETTPQVVRRIYRRVAPEYLEPLTKALGDRVFGVPGYTVTGDDAGGHSPRRQKNVGKTGS